MNVPISDSGQLDLFLHSGAVALANNVADALFARDAVSAAECLDRLRAHEPDHQACKALETLCQVLREWPLPSSSPAEIDNAIRRLETAQPGSGHVRFLHGATPRHPSVSRSKGFSALSSRAVS